MSAHYAPRDHVGHYDFPEGCTEAWVDECRAITSIELPEGCEAQVYNCPNYIPAK